MSEHRKPTRARRRWLVGALGLATAGTVAVGAGSWWGPPDGPLVGVGPEGLGGGDTPAADPASPPATTTALATPTATPTATAPPASPTAIRVPRPGTSASGTVTLARQRTATATRLRPSASAATRRAATTAPARTTPAARSGSGLSAAEQTVVDLVNRERAAHGCGALVVDRALQTAAHDYAGEMVDTHHFDHTSTAGLDPSERARAAGYRGGVGENIFMGWKGDPASAVAGWMNSSGHRANILNCGYTRTGVGYDPGTIDPAYAAGSWVQDFGS